MNNIIKVLQVVKDKHAPIKKVTNAKKRQLKKPWISNGILNSIKTKQKMFKTHFLSHDQVKVNFVKKYNNKLNKIKELAKRTYFSTQFYLNKEDIKMTWKLIGMIINRKKKSNIIIPKLLHNNRCYTDKQSIREQLNTYFINVGPTLSAQLPIHRNSDSSKYIRGTFSNNFFFSLIHEYEVCDLIVILIGNNQLQYRSKVSYHRLARRVSRETRRVSFLASALEVLIRERIDHQTP